MHPQQHKSTLSGLNIFLLRASPPLLFNTTGGGTLESVGVLCDVFATAVAVADELLEILLLVVSVDGLASSKPLLVVAALVLISVVAAGC